MRILWIVNTIFPAPSEVIGFSSPVSGGWMYGLAEQLYKVDGVELAVTTTYIGSEIKKMTIKGIHYFLLPCKDQTRYDAKLEDYWSQVCVQFQPDVVHIHGTEFTHGLACMRKLPNLNYVISIQGLVSVCSRYYYGGISFWDIFRNITFRDIVRMDTLFQQKRKFEKRGEFEKEYIQRTKHLIGRTNWDYAHSKVINPKVKYHFCNESLREGFYSAKKWSFENCNKYTIFLSQADYPLKGLSQVLKALVILRRDFPNFKIKIGGNDITKKRSLKDTIRISGYAKYISKSLKKLGLNNDVVFLGNLTEKKMIEEYQKAHVFICPSSIENSPNSLGEAQLIGTPVIASYVGGIPNMVKNCETGMLYRFEEVEMLVENIRRIFEDDNLACSLSINGIKAAKKRHDLNVNLKRVIEIYNEIVFCK